MGKAGSWSGGQGRAQENLKILLSETIKPDCLLMGRAALTLSVVGPEVTQPWSLQALQ